MVFLNSMTFHEQGALSVQLTGASRERQTMNFGERDLVGDLEFSQEGGPQTHQSVLEMSRNTGTRRSLVDCHICDLCLCQNHPAGGKRRAYSAANALSGSEVTEPR